MSQVLFVHAEADLIPAARAGDGSAFAELVRPHYQAAFRVAYGLLHDVDEAEDAVQEAAFKAWRLAAPDSLSATTRTPGPMSRTDCLLRPD